MKLKYFIMSLVIVLLVSLYCMAECPLDHFIIGVNQDGKEGTDDDRKLFVDCSQKYRDSGTIEYSNWFYPLNQSIFSSYPYRLGEPGFDAFQDFNPNAAYTYDPNKALIGQPNIDYRIIVHCLSMSGNLRAVHKDFPQFTIDKSGQEFNHSDIHELRGDSHIHMSYQGADGKNLYWITFYLYDEFADVNNPDDPNHYQPSKSFSVVFNREPLPGDLVINEQVDQNDLAELSYYWLKNKGSRSNDYYERVDTNRDGIVNFIDYAIFAKNRENIHNME
ncbi:MAG: hypothetical protein JW787_09520 [Sedimentisphaerales bacterium]|nr:hypothetical protein [Sedimentisphaerales bacterium]